MWPCCGGTIHRQIYVDRAFFSVPIISHMTNNSHIHNNSFLIIGYIVQPIIRKHNVRAALHDLS